ncbi:MAG: asparagine synthase (glutamine-hydrolyzing) [Bacteroidota bacterium]
MCGISGIFTLEPESVNISGHLLQMSKTLRHRGPDDEGFFLATNHYGKFFSGNDTPENVSESGLIYTSIDRLQNQDTGFNFGFCHRRLSILDLSPRGHQPMCDSEQKVVITFNGEIYNYLEIRRELQSKGYQFYTQSDTEVILNSYKEWGEKCLQHFNGMWSFVIFDREKNELFCSRDRFGVKPFYYYLNEKIFCFASEQKAIVGLPFVNTIINDEAVYDFLVKNETEYKTEGFFKNVLELFPGNFMRVNLTDLKIHIERYYQLNYNSDFFILDEIKFNEAKEETERLLIDAVKLRLRSDVPVGSCLSGGIDSSVIAGIMQEASGNLTQPNFFTAVFPGTGVDESFYAEEVVKRGGHWHKVTPSAEELWKDLDELIYSQDIPIWSSSTYSQFRVMKLAKEHRIKVLLDGQGGDELFAGYHPHYLSFWNELSKNNQKRLLSTEIKNSSVPGGAGTFRFKQKIKSALKTANSKLANRIMNKEMSFLNQNFLMEFSSIEQESFQFYSLNEHLNYEFNNTRLKLYLKCEDRCSMWHSVESRTPFADDINLINYVFGLPGSVKIRDGTLKYLLRKAAGKYLPQKIAQRKDKMGYVTPHNAWLREVYKYIQQEDFTGLKPYIDLDKLRKNLHTLYSPANDKERFLAFKILSFLRWKRVFNI